jgi:hypothetical protein
LAVEYWQSVPSVFFGSFFFSPCLCASVAK